MALTKTIEAIRTDPTLSEQERIWKALKIIAKHLDDGDEDDLIGAIFGA